MVGKERPVALFAPSIRAIKLFGDGRIEYRGQSGSVVGATAGVDSSGSREGGRDTREVILRIEGPDVAIVVALAINGVQSAQARPAICRHDQ